MSKNVCACIGDWNYLENASYCHECGLLCSDVCKNCKLDISDNSGKYCHLCGFKKEQEKICEVKIDVTKNPREFIELVIVELQDVFNYGITKCKMGWLNLTLKAFPKIQLLTSGALPFSYQEMFFVGLEINDIQYYNGKDAIPAFRHYCLQQK